MSEELSPNRVGTATPKSQTDSEKDRPPNGKQEKSQPKPTKNRGEKLAMKEKRLAIYHATLEECFVNGIGKATTAEIAKKAGIGTGTLFCYFANKMQLLNYVYKEIIANLTKFTLENLKNEPDYSKEAQLRKLWQYQILWYKEHSRELNFLLSSVHPGGASSPYISDEVLEETGSAYDEIKEIFQAAVENKILKPLPPMLHLRIFLANATTVASLYQSRASLAAFIVETPQILSELENAAWDMIALKPQQ